MDNNNTQKPEFSKKIPPEKIWSGAIAWMTKNNVAANILMFAMLIGGFIFLLNTKQEVMPPFEVDTVSIQLTLSGASPEEVEKGMVIAVEDAVRGLELVEKVETRIYTGSASITATAIDGVDRQEFLNDIQNEVDRINTFPDEAEDPNITLNTYIREVVSLVLSGSDDQLFLREWAENIKNEFLAQPDITQVELDDLSDIEIQIEIPQDTLRKYGLTLNQVANTIKVASVEQGAGSIETSAGDINVKVNDRRDYGDEFGQISVLSNADGSRVLLEDIATIKEDLEDGKSWTEYDNKPAIVITVYRVGNQTPKMVSDDTIEVIEKLNQSLPGGLNLEILRNDADTFSDRSDLLVSNAVMGIVLVFACLALFLEPKLAMWVSLGIPVSIIGSFLFITPYGESINMMSMFAFLITLGIVVDDAIVVGENVHIWRRRGYNRAEAAVLGTKEIAVPIVFSVLTNIVAFIPIALLPGFMGMLYAPLVPVVCSVFFCSLIESLFVMPCHLGHDKKPQPGSILFKISAAQRKFSHAFTKWVENVWGPLLHKLLKAKYSVVAFCIALLILIGAFVASGRMGMEIMPATESDYAYAEITMPSSTSEARLREISRDLYITAEEVINENGGPDQYKGVYINVRGSKVRAYLNLIDAELRPLSTSEVTRVWQQKFGSVLGAETINFQADRGGPGSGKALQVRLSHSDAKVLENAADELAKAMANYPIVSDIDTGASKQDREVQIHLTPLAEQLGLTSQDVSSQLRSYFEGVTALKQQRGSDEITIRLRLPEDERSNEGSLQNVVLRTPSNEEVLLYDAVDIVEGYTPAIIQRTDGQRVISVTANVTPRTEAATILSDIEQNIMPDLASRFPGLTWVRSGMQEDIDDSMSALYTGLTLALLGIYVLLAIPFKSYTQPIIIMIAIPFGVVGAIIGHLIMGYSLSVVSFLGILALSGLVVNDSLVLISFANLEKDRGLSTYDAVHSAGVRRFRPILLTTMTTFIGLAPMLLETSRQARQLIPVAISLGFGVLFATVITLALVPALYIIFDDISNFFSKKR